MEGIQDLTLAAKYSMFEFPSTRLGALRGIGVMSVGVPLSDYTPDFQPLSIGLGTTRVSARFTFNAQSRPGWFVNGSLAHTWRMDVKLDRPYYFTDGQFFMTDEVVMPTTFDYVGSVGYLKDGLMAAFSVSQQWTLGGGDIRRQDMPFISNRMHFSKVGGMVMYPIPKFDALALRFGYAYTIGGRNVGQSQTFTTGVLYRFRFFERATQ
jgi:hypothetical protein